MSDKFRAWSELSGHPPIVSIRPLTKEDIRGLSKEDVEKAIAAEKAFEAKVWSSNEIKRFFFSNLFGPRDRSRGSHARLRISNPELEAPKGVLIDWLVPPDRAEDMLLGLQKAFEERWVPKYGLRCAQRMFLWHAVGSVIGFWINWTMKRTKLLKFLSGSGA
jgi:hypothetical protein